MYSFHGQCIDVPKTFTNLWPWNKVSQDILMGIIDFILFILFIGFSQQEDWNGLPFPSLVDHILSELSMTCLSWVALHVMAHSFIELCSPFSWQGCELWTKDQVANIHWIIEKAREFQKNIYFCFKTDPSLYGKWKGKKRKKWQILFSWVPKALCTVTAAMTLKD